MIIICFKINQKLVALKTNRKQNLICKPILLPILLNLFKASLKKKELGKF